MCASDLPAWVKHDCVPVMVYAMMVVDNAANEESRMNRGLPFKEATPRQIKQRLDAGEPLTLIDVREREEVMTAAIDGAREYPLSGAMAWIDTLPQEGDLVIFCHHGARSAQVALALAQRGHTNVTNMAGGIDQWSQQVDPGVPRY